MNITKRSDCENGVITWPGNRTDLTKKLFSSDRIIDETLNEVDTGVDNRVDMSREINSRDNLVTRLDRQIFRNMVVARALNRVDTKTSNVAGIIKRPNSEDKVITGVQSKKNTKDFRKLDLLIFVDNYVKDFSSSNLTEILANLFGDLSPTSINIYSFFTFSIFFFFSTTSIA